MQPTTVSFPPLSPAWAPLAVHLPLWGSFRASWPGRRSADTALQTTPSSTDNIGIKIGTLSLAATEAVLVTIDDQLTFV